MGYEMGKLKINNEFFANENEVVDFQYAWWLRVPVEQGDREYTGRKVG